MSNKAPTPKPQIPTEWRQADSLVWSARAFAERDNRNLSANHLACLPAGLPLPSPTTPVQAERGHAP